MSETQPSAFDGLGAPPVEMMGFVAPPDSSPSVVTAGLEHTKRHGGGLSVMRWFLVGLCIVIVVVALVVWMVILAPGHPSGGSSGGATDLRSTTAPTWSAPISVSLLTPDYYDLSMENMMIAVSRGRLNETFFGINLAKHRVAWTIPNVDGWGYSGDQTGFVIASSSDLRVIDPMTGKVTAKTQLASGQVLLWAGDGMILVDDYHTASLCARAMAAPGECVWTAADVDLPNPLATNAQNFVFGNGKWVNTGAGVVEMATGQAASFGADAGNGQQLIYYTGGSSNRIFRVTSPGPFQSQTGVCTYQPWDTTSDSAISPAVQADRVDADPSTSVYVAIVDEPTSQDTVIGYSWQSGDELWQAATYDLPGYSAAQFVGHTYVMETRGDVNGWPVAAFDSTTGQMVWRSDGYLTLAGVMQNVILVDQLTSLAAVDATNGYTTLWSVDVPSNCASVHVLTNHIVCTNDSSQIWVLNT